MFVLGTRRLAHQSSLRICLFSPYTTVRPLSYRPLKSPLTLSLLRNSPLKRNYWWSPKPLPPPPPPSLESLDIPDSLPPVKAIEVDTSLSDHIDISAVTNDLSTTLPLQLGDLASLGLSPYNPAGIMRSTLELINVTTGLPWYATIVLFGVLSRFVLFPLIISSTKHNARQLTILPQLEILKKSMTNAQQRGDVMAVQKSVLKMQKLLKDNDVNPLKALVVPMVQIGIALPSFFAIRSMCHLPVQQLKTGGFSWVTDLTVADPYYILPALATGAMIIVMRRAAADSPSSNVQMTGHMSNFFLVIALVSFPVMMNFPAGLLLYFTANGSILVLQSLLFRLPAFRQRFKLPALPAKSITTQQPTMLDSAKLAQNWFKNKMKEIDQAKRSAK